MDIVALQETHVCADSFERFKIYFGEFEQKWIPATRQSNYGRGIGGYFLGIKKDLRIKGFNSTFQTIENMCVICIKTQNTAFTIIPIYMRSAMWEETYEIVKNVTRHSEVVNPIVIGDLNVRIGNMQILLDEVYKEEFSAGFEKRKSKDIIINNRGRQFLDLCYDSGLFVINGMTAGDENGEFTFVSGVGESVNDICAVSQDLLKFVEKFNVDDKMWSDHFPIILTLKMLTKENKSKLLPKLHWNPKGLAKYQSKVSSVLQDRKQTTISFTCGDIVKIIKEAHYDATLKKYRANSSEENRLEYRDQRQKYKEICQKAKDSYYKIIESNLERVQNKDLQTHFKNLLNPHQEQSDIQYAHNLQFYHELDTPITLSEVKKVLSKTKDHKAPGEDRVPYEFFKNAPNDLLAEIVNTFNTLYDSGCVDESLLRTIIYPIFKKGDRTLSCNYRGIAFMNCIAKIMMGILNERLSLWSEKHKILNEYQAGFRKNYSTSDNIYNLSSIVHLNFSQKKKTYAFFVDFKAAFDNISRKALIFKLQSIGMSTKAVRFIENVYKDTTSAVWTGNELSEYFNTTSGVKQGCLLSPLLFALYLNDLHDTLEGGVNLNGLNVRLLLYADDIVILADEPNVLQQMIYNLEEYCKLWTVEVNLNKSKIMVFRKGGRIARNENWTFKSNPVTITSEYCYLGVTLTPSMSFSKHVEKRNQAAKTSINSTWNDFLKKQDVPLQSKWKLFLAVSRSIQSYAAQVWGYKHFEEVDKLQTYFIKRMLNLPDCIPTYAIMLETSIENGHIFTLDLNIRYVFKTLFEYDESRLPFLLSKKILQNKLSWVKRLNEMGAEHDIEWSINNLNKTTWKENGTKLLQALR
ncbi:uncharacterized protein LOC131998381, partial [Stomoxys calcitrans]|uniref:uncharacterized protein LOC131998381 n=1 Tax=Stomoxys calcitrans TaxID=35570 RepID=UPI0027E2FBA8